MALSPTFPPILHISFTLWQRALFKCGVIGPTTETSQFTDVIITLHWHWDRQFEYTTIHPVQCVRAYIQSDQRGNLPLKYLNGIRQWNTTMSKITLFIQIGCAFRGDSSSPSQQDTGLERGCGRDTTDFLECLCKCCMVYNNYQLDDWCTRSLMNSGLFCIAPLIRRRMWMGKQITMTQVITNDLYLCISYFQPLENVSIVDSW
jgi:hypothetical protein